MVKYENKDDMKQKPPFNNTHALPQKGDIWFTQ